MPVIFVICVVVVGWIIGMNFVWWVQVPLFIGTVYLWKTKCGGLEGIFLGGSLGIIWVFVMVANLIYAAAHPGSFDFLYAVGRWFLP